MDCSPPGSAAHGDSPGKNTGVGCHALLQGIFPTQGSNLGFLPCRQILCHLSHLRCQGMLGKLEMPRGCSVRSWTCSRPAPVSHLLIPRAAPRPQHIWPTAAPPGLLAGCPKAPFAPGHLVPETSCLWPGMFSSTGPVTEGSVRSMGPGVPGVRFGTSVWERSENRSPIGEGGRGREGGAGSLPDRLTQTLREAEKLPTRWP